MRRPRVQRFENEMGEPREPPSDGELPPIESYGDSYVQDRAWHSFNPVNCNLFHEVDAGLAGNQKDVGIRYLTQGGRRDTWQLDRAPPRPRQREPERVILKTLRWYQPYDERFFDNQWRDALALERLQDSLVSHFGTSHAVTPPPTAPTTSSKMYRPVPCVVSRT